MRKLLESAGGLLMLVGVAGAIRELTGWFPFLGGADKLLEQVPYLDDQALFTYVVVAVVGFVLVMIAEAEPGRR
ncbi:hypothetical protein [Streptomyces sp. NPDC058953]|uniref:hypothetical protein n=1 Tax=unclassified Streptomyces TaxID=2593676 RepID=UPI0036B17590